MFSIFYLIIRGIGGQVKHFSASTTTMVFVSILELLLLVLQ